MGKVLYEASFKFESGYIGIIVFVVIAVFIPYLAKKGVFSKVKTNIEVIKVFGVCARVCIFLWVSVALLFQIHFYIKVIGSYKNGNYQIVEGYVENFDPMPYGGHKEESFEIDSVKFVYSDFNIIQGYHNAKSHGGVITGNGQHLKVGYVCYNKAYGNIIVYIEELP